ncbi:MAG: hypothetical protein V3V47_00400 [Desulfobacteria bacterium]
MKLFLLYLWTAPDANMPGLYYISPGTIADDLETDTDTIRERLRNGSGNGWFNYDEKARLIFFPKWTNYDPPPNKNTVTSYTRQLLDLPESALRDCYARTLEPYIKRYAVPLSKPYMDRFRCPSPSPSPLPSPSPKEIKSKSHCASATDVPPQKEGKHKYEPEEELRREDATRIVQVIENWDCMKGSKMYQVAGKIRNILSGKDADTAIQILKEKSEHLCKMTDIHAFYAYLTGIYRKSDDIGEIESRAHRIDDGTKRGGDPKRMKRIIEESE